MDHAELKQLIVRLTKRRGVNKSICPSEAARHACPDDWRAVLPAVRSAAIALVNEGNIEVLQRGERVDLERVSGPIRLRYLEQR